MSRSDSPGLALLVTGTDLGVGKTYVAAGLARLLKDRGIDVGVMKPVEVGWPKDTGQWPPDADRLREAAGIDDPIEDVVPYAYEEMVAPQVAADQHHDPVEPDVLKAALDRLRAKHQIVIVEGAGGLAVPIDDGFDMASFAHMCGMPVLVVSRAHVGTLNHTFLTVHYARSRGLEIVGVIANRLDRTLHDPTVDTNARMIERMCGAPVLGMVPFRPESDTLEDVVDTCNSCFDMDAFMNRVGLTTTSKG